MISNRNIHIYPILSSHLFIVHPRLCMCLSIRFVGGTKPGRNTGFDMDEDDLLYMEQCTGVVVASYIFGVYFIMPILYSLTLVRHLI